MNENMKNTNTDASFGRFVMKHMLPVIGGVVVILVVLWFGLQYFGTPDPHTPVQTMHVEESSHTSEDALTAESEQAPVVHQTASTPHEPVESGAHATVQPQTPPKTPVPQSQTHTAGAETQSSHGVSVKTSDTGHGSAAGNEGHADSGHGAAPAKSYPKPGMAFVDAVIHPMDYELNGRFWGWRPNDIIEYTDNINNFQLGVLEVTRRTSRILAERISRTGSSARFDPNLETAMNWFMIKADRYWFPSAESKYKDGLEELRHYYDKLGRGEAEFYTRTDNLIPLLKAYEDLLGSCDENLVKTHEADGSKVSFFDSDDYFFYTKGVASTLHTILSAIAVDFNIMVSREGGLEVLHHAIEMCHHATELDPWLILNSDYSSIFANHRSNMAAPISHARFYVGVLIKALST